MAIAIDSFWNQKVILSAEIEVVLTMLDSKIGPTRDELKKF